MTARPAGRQRWTVVALLFAATVINYVDRQMIGILKPTLSSEFGWSEGQYADIVFWFTVAYALGYVSFGRLIDVVGSRIGYAIAFTIWRPLISRTDLPGASSSSRWRVLRSASANPAVSRPQSSR